MIYRGRKRFGNRTRLKGAMVAALAIGITLIMCKRAVGLSIAGDYAKNVFYVQVVNYTLPVVKVTSFQDEDLAESDYSLKDKALEFFGFSLKSPMSIMNREISYTILDNNKVVPINKNLVSIDPFQLNSSGINLNSTQGENGSSDKGESYPDKKVDIFDPNLSKQINKSKPEVFIYHTHTTEAYGLNQYYLNDENKDVVAVGDAIAKELESKYGISVIHDKTVHNAQTLVGAYGRSGNTVDKYLKQYGDFKLIIDLHRDAVGKENKKAVTTKMNGEQLARYMFVMANKNPHYDKNLALVNKMISISEKTFPGLLRDAKDGKGMYYYNKGTAYFNQHKSNNAVLIEVGAEVNTLDEATASGKYIARVIAETINGKN